MAEYLGQLLEERLRCEKRMPFPVEVTLTVADGVILKRAVSDETRPGRWLPLRWRGPCTTGQVTYERIS